MSVRIMAEVFDRYPGGGTELLLALAIADHAHDDGTHVYPSVKRLAEKTRQSERSVQYHLRAMESSGWLLLVGNATGGRNMPREYRINPAWIKGANFAAPEKGADFDEKGCNPAPERVQPSVGKGATAIAPEPSDNHKAIVREPSAAKRKREPAPTFELPDWVPADVWNSWWLVTRKKIRAPNTDDAFKLNLRALEKLRTQGHDPRAVIEQSIERGYRGLFPVKLENPNGSTPPGARRESTAERAERINRELDARDGIG